MIADFMDYYDKIDSGRVHRLFKNRQNLCILLAPI